MMKKMKAKSFNRYSFPELLEAATSPEATQEDVDTLGEWFSAYGNDDWNGECYDASSPSEPTGTRSLYPVYKPDPDSDGDFLLTGYSFDRPI